MGRESHQQRLARGLVRLKRAPGGGGAPAGDAIAADSGPPSDGAAGRAGIEDGDAVSGQDTRDGGPGRLRGGTAHGGDGDGAAVGAGIAGGSAAGRPDTLDSGSDHLRGGAVRSEGDGEAAAGTGSLSAEPIGAAEKPRTAGRTGTGMDGPGPAGRLRLRWALLAGLAGGAALTAAFPPYGIWPLAAAGPALLAVALWRQSLRGALAAGLVFGLAFFVPLLSWVVNVAWYAWAALSVSEAVIFAVLAVGQRLLLRLRAWPVAVAGWWVAAEAFRDRWPWGGFPWGRLAMSQAQAPSLRWVSAGGPPLLTFLVALTGACLAWLAIERRVLPAACLACAAGVTLAGAALPVTTSGPVSAPVAAVQGDVPHARNLPTLFNDTQITQNHATATEQLAAQVRAGVRPAPGIVVWPENSTNLDPFEYPAIYTEIMAAVRAIGRPVLVGELLDNPVRNVGQLWVPGRGRPPSTPSASSCRSARSYRSAG